jgi:hypothetical protein
MTLLAAAARAQEPGPSAAPTPFQAAVEERYRAHVAAHGENREMLVRRGLLADRRARRVTLDAVASREMGANDPVEFLLIGQESAKAYEALAVAFARPGEVREALLFIGLPAGRSVNFQRFCYWPKGERVTLTFRWRKDDGQSAAVRAESLVVNRQTGKPLPAAGLVFTGSVEVESPSDPAARVLAADAYDPYSIAANYNEPNSVCDLPRRAPQGDVYETQFPNADARLPEDRLLEVVIEPEYPEGKRRVRELTLEARPRPGAAGSGLAAVELTLREGAGGKILAERAELPAVLQAFTGVVAGGQDPFVTLSFDDALTVETVRVLCTLLSTVETENGIRVEPPPEGHPYYLAFVGGEQHRDRAARFSQPWELHLQPPNGAVRATLTRIEEIWKDETLKPELKVTDIPVASPQAARAEMDKSDSLLPVVLVFVPPSLPYGQLARYLQPVLPTRPMVHVLLDPAPAEPR